MSRSSGSKNKRGATPENVVEPTNSTPEVTEQNSVVENPVVETVSENITVSVPSVEPIVEYHEQEEKVIIPEKEPVAVVVDNMAIVVPEGKLLVDKKLFYKMAYALGTSKTFAYTGFAAIRVLGQMLGATTHQEELDKWQEIKNEQ